MVPQQKQIDIVKQLINWILASIATKLFLLQFSKWFSKKQDYISYKLWLQVYRLNRVLISMYKKEMIPHEILKYK